jgi:hypothetical protein
MRSMRSMTGRRRSISSDNVEQRLALRHRAREIIDVAFVLQHPGNRHLELRGRHGTELSGPSVHCGCASACRRPDQSCSFSISSLPAGLDHAGHFARIASFAQLVAAQAELAEIAARAAGQFAAIAQTHGLALRGSCWNLSRASMRSSSESLALLMMASSSARLAHIWPPSWRAWLRDSSVQVSPWFPQFLKGNLKAARSALASSSVFAVVVMLMFMPRRHRSCRTRSPGK